MRRIQSGSRRQSTERCLVGRQHFIAEAGQDHSINRLVIGEKVADGADRDVRGIGDWITVDTATDRGERNRAYPIGHGELQALRVAARQEFRLAMLPVAVARPDGVDHELCG